ncbi:hypothetical protein Pmani_013869 [Petrolisthes manimaculis]|uniref:Uncharacterized protein n=1 Tax=Petrolisthes manimaculis TaxID=1843537 RepID=A0AAE1PWG2_9EUCA|nr:hypothetical protein Pmani_013869 [Petrolisthes manimaculis]
MPGPRKRKYEKRIKWTQRKEDMKWSEFKTNVLKSMDCDGQDVNKWWKTNAETVRTAAREVLGQTSGLLNQENHRDYYEDGTPCEGPTRPVERLEVEKALKKMKRNKAVGLDNIPMEAWFALGKEGVDILWICSEMCV